MSTQENHNVEEEMAKQEETVTENAEQQAAAEAAEEQQEVADPVMQELKAAKATIEEQKDKYLRLSAEFDNYRKRTLKEKAELIKNGGEKAISAILPILDDLERALQNMQKADDVKAMYEGIDLIYQKFLKGKGQAKSVKIKK